jgi:predicted SAM-dependent methyltransferase
MSNKLLNIGCGYRYHSDWINIDHVKTGPEVIVHDINKGLPFENGSIDAVYHAHVLEHFSKHDGAQLIQECYRVLKPGGILRVVVPDLEQICRLYITYLDQVRDGDSEVEHKYDWMKLELLDQMVRKKSGGLMLRYLMGVKGSQRDFIIDRVGKEAKDIFEAIDDNKSKQTMETSISHSPLMKYFKTSFWREKLLHLLLGDSFTIYQQANFRAQGEIHQWMYDSFSLERLLDKVGLNEISEQTAAHSYIPDFSEYHLDTNESTGKPLAPNSMYMEGVK